MARGARQDAVNVDKIPAFKSWLIERGLTEGTIDVYVGDVRLAAAAGGFLPRVTSNDLAPKTRHRALSAARQWANFSEDHTLLKKLGAVRLPPAYRQKAKVPLEKAQLFEIIDEIDRATYLSPSVRAVLGLMACRGLRVGDALRIERAELQAARDSGTLSYKGKGRKQVELKLIKTFRRWVMQLTKLADDDGDWTRVSELVAPHAAPKNVQRAAAKKIERGLFLIARKLQIWGLHPHRLRRTYAVEYLRQLKGDPEAIIKLRDHMRWASINTALEYVDHARGDELDKYAEGIFER
jgi:integrase